MKRVRFCGLLLGCFLGTMISAKADEVVKSTEVEPVIETKNILSFSAKQADWVFSGMVTNESGERYNYFFQLQRDNQKFHAIAALIDAQTNELIIYEESDAIFEEPENTQWQVGRAFLRFNAINNSWIFGVKNKDKKGFNFKVDMLGLSEGATKQQDIRKGLELLVNQTGRLNGHLQGGDDSKEQFVTAKKAWFRQMWVSKPQELSHPMTAVLCQFNDGGGFYSVNLKESDVLRGAIAGWRDEQGTPIPMSQFVTVKEDKEGLWRILISSPKMTLTFKDLLHQVDSKHYLIAGTVKGVMPGFCAISRHDIGQPSIEQST